MAVKDINMTRQLAAWEGAVGDAYSDQNGFEEWKIPQGERAFDRILSGYDFTSVLEVGSNTGSNLRYMNGVTRGRVKFYALEPNRRAYKILTSQNSGFKLEHAFNCGASEIPAPDNSIDLVFTCSVLNYIHPDNLSRVTDEIVRVSKKYVLCIESFSSMPVEIEYHGRKGLFFKQDYGKFFSERYPNLQCLDYGFLWREEFPIFDNLNWWIFLKTSD